LLRTFGDTGETDSLIAFPVRLEYCDALRAANLYQEGDYEMDPFVGQILMVAFNFAPNGWALCNGQILPIYQNQALFSLLGTQFGGNGTSTFALPDLQGRVPVHMGNSDGNNYVIGQVGGAESVTLSINNLPSHNHTANCSTTLGPVTDPAKCFWSSANTGGKKAVATPSYAATANATMAATAIGNTGAGLPISVVEPYLCMNFIIALQGIYPSRN
jgi:microcystin-dependent protein